MRRDLRGQSLGMCIFGRSTESSVNYPSIFLSLHMCIYIYTYASIYLSINLSFYLFIYLSINLSISLTYLMFLCIYIYYFISSSLFLHKIFIYTYVYIYICIYIYTYIYLHTYIYIYRSVKLFMYPSAPLPICLLSFCANLNGCVNLYTLLGRLQ